LVALEAGGNAHVDVAAAGLTAAALLVLAAARSARKTGAGAALLGLAIATKPPRRATSRSTPPK